MGPSESIDRAFSRLAELDQAWREPSAGERLVAVREGALRVRDRIGESGRVACVRTFDTSALPYPTLFAFGGAAISPLPYVTMMNRMQLVQFVTKSGEKKTLLFNPTDAEKSAATPFFKIVQGPMSDAMFQRLKTLLAKPTPVQHLAEIGVSPEQVDYIAFDHLHTQDLRRTLGTAGEPGRFPRAKLLVWRPELDILRGLHPLQRPWFVPQAIEGVATDRILVVEEGDWLLGAGVALIRTPGHTVGNWSLALATDSGIWVVSENGVSCDNYAPEASKIPGLARFARKWGQEVVLNSNTLELRNEQYTSMILEKTLADPCRERPEFRQHFASSELVRSPISIGLWPTYAHGRITSGDVATTRRPAERSASAHA